MEPGKDIYGSLFVPPDLEYEFNTQSFSASIGYKILFSHYIGMFSLIDFQLSAGYSSINKNYPAENFSHKEAKVDGISNRYEIFEADNSMLSIKDIKFIDFSITTPIIFLWNNFSINCGVGLQTSFVHYKIRYDFSYRKFESEFLAPEILYSESGEGIEKEDIAPKLSLSPVINCAYYFNTPFVLQSRITTNSFSVNIGMEF